MERDIEMPEFLQSLTRILNEYDFAEENKDEVISEIIDKYYNSLKAQSLKKKNIQPAPENLRPAVNLTENSEMPINRLPDDDKHNLFDDIKRKLREEELKRENRRKQREEEEKRDREDRDERYDNRREYIRDDNRYNDNNVRGPQQPSRQPENNSSNDKIIIVKKEIYCEFVNLGKLYSQLYDKSKKASEKMILKEMMEELDGLLTEIKTFNVRSQSLNNIECRDTIALPRSLCASYKRVFEYVTYLISKLNKLKNLDSSANVDYFITSIVVTLTVHQNKLNSLILNCIF